MSETPAIDLSGAPAPVQAAIDLSGVPAPAIDMSGAPVATVPSPDPVAAPAPPASEPATVPPVQTPVAAPVAALSKELSDAVNGIAHDLSGVGMTGVTVGDLLRFVPRLASLVHTLQIRGNEKRDMVIAAVHALVDRVFGEGERPAAHALVDVVCPHAIAAVIDVVAGRVTFQQAATTAAVSSATAAAANPVVVAQAGNCLTQLLACLAKK